MERYINPEKIDFRIPYYPDEDGGDALVSLRAVKQCIDAAPSEDVVPREELDAMRGAANSYKMHYESAKTDVAREIFEEIEQQLRGLFDFFRQDQGIRESGAIMLAISEIAELKKKYKCKEDNE